MRKTITVAFFAGIVLALCFPPVGLFFVMPLALACLLGTLDTLTPRLAFYSGLAFGIGFFGVALHWLWNLFGTGSIGLWAICALFPALFAALFVGTTPRFPKRFAPLIAAFLWTGIEIFRSEWMYPAFPFLGLGYAFVKAPGFASLASVFGCYGITFLVVLFSATLAPILATDIKAGSVRPAVVLAGWMAILFFPRPTPTPVRPVNLRLVQAPTEDTTNLTSLSVPDETRKPDVIVWPEYSFISDVRGDTKEWAKIKGVAQSTGAYLLFGAKDETENSFSPPPSQSPAISGKSGTNPVRKPFVSSSESGQKLEFKNTAFLLDPSGEVVAKHVKNHTVPFVKDGVAGTLATVADTPKGKFGIAICYDLDFPDVSRKMAQQGAEIFLVPSNNPDEWGSVQRVQHAQMFQMRAIECGRWIAVADVAGSTALYAPNGRNTLPLRRDDPFGGTFTAGLETHRTIYVAFGWLFPYFCLIGSVGLLLLALARQVPADVSNGRIA